MHLSILQEAVVVIEVVVDEVLEAVEVEEVHVHSALIVVFMATSKKNVGILWENLHTMLTLLLLTHQAVLVWRHYRGNFSLFLPMSIPSSYSIKQLNSLPLLLP